MINKLKSIDPESLGKEESRGNADISLGGRNRIDFKGRLMVGIDGIGYGDQVWWRWSDGRDNWNLGCIWEVRCRNLVLWKCPGIYEGDLNEDL